MKEKVKLIYERGRSAEREEKNVTEKRKKKRNYHNYYRMAITSGLNELQR